MTDEDKNNPQPPQETTLAITGMTCVNCEVVVERAIRAIPGVRSAHVDYRRGVASVASDEALDISRINVALAEEGYGAAEAQAAPAKRKARIYTEAAAAVLIVLGVFLAARQFNLLPRSLSVTDNMTYGFVLLIGLIASVSSCMAVTGGLLVALAAKYNEATQGLSARQRFIPHLFFNAGRIISYTLLGGLIGAAGAALTFSALATGILTIVLSAIMVLIGLQMLGVMPPVSRLLPRLPKGAVHRIHDLAVTQSRTGAFVLGAATFFLPCGFTLALQLYVLTKGSFAVGALTMLVFAIGTLPALLSLSVLSSFASGITQVRFARLAGAAVIFLGLMNIQYGLVQTGSDYIPVSPFAAAPLEASAAAQSAPARQVQIAEMKIDGFEYVPNRFTVKAGCGRVLIMRGAGIMKFLSSDEINVISFTPARAGELAFNCSMGMMTPNSGFTVTN
jgi:sulfite exporter TauE/SafE/copper chaperone CopZ